MTATRWTLLRAGAAAAVLALVAWRVGASAFVDGFAAVDRGALVGAAALTALATVCCAWRWRAVARSLGDDVPLRRGIAACYRSQFLNSSLPGGVLGDVHRGVSQGRRSGGVGLGVRAVVWERSAGQAVQLLLTLAVLLLLPSPLRAVVPAVALLGAAAAAALLVLVLGGRVRGGGRPRRLLGAVSGDARSLLRRPTAWPGVVIPSVVVVAAHTGTFVIAARAAGVSVPAVRLLPLAVVVLLAMALPVTFAGWGPREGVAAWAFATAGLGAATGVTVAVVYGVIAFVSTLPGAGLALRDVLRTRSQELAARSLPEETRPELAVLRG